MLLAPAPARLAPTRGDRVVVLSDPPPSPTPVVLRDRDAPEQPPTIGELARRDPATDGSGVAGAIAQAIVEVLAGLRPVTQLTPHVTPAVLAKIRAAATGAGTSRSPRQRIGHLRVTSPAFGVIEACAVVRGGPRSRALAIRLESLDGRWRCSAVESG